jgi:hypothetical protein
MKENNMVVTFQGKEYDFLSEDDLINFLRAIETCTDTIIAPGGQQILPIFTNKELIDAYELGKDNGAEEEKKEKK